MKQCSLGIPFPKVNVGQPGSCIWLPLSIIYSCVQPRNFELGKWVRVHDCSCTYHRREPLTTGPWLAQVFDSACIYNQESKTIDLVPLLAPLPAIWAMNRYQVCSCCLPQLFSPEWSKKPGSRVFWWLSTGETCYGTVESSSYMEDVSFSTFSSRDGLIWPASGYTDFDYSRRQWQRSHIAVRVGTSCQYKKLTWSLHPQERRRQQDFMKHFHTRRVIPVICYHMKLWCCAPSKASCGW